MKEISLYWWRGSGGKFTNIGDEINGRIVEFVSGRKVQRTELIKSDLLAIGSILRFPQDHKIIEKRKIPYLVWGSGTLFASDLSYQEKFVLSSVRGPLTYSLFSSSRHPGATMNFGDPGILVSHVWPSAKVKRYSWGIIPHFSQKSKPWVERMLENTPNSTLIDVQNPDISAVMQKISECEFIAATSLHGLVFADSYRIPSVWLWDGAPHRGGAWKFHDYSAGVGRRLSDPVLCSNSPDNLGDIDLSTMSFQHFGTMDLIERRTLSAFPL